MQKDILLNARNMNNEDENLRMQSKEGLAMRAKTKGRPKSTDRPMCCSTVELQLFVGRQTVTELYCITVTVDKQTVAVDSFSRQSICISLYRLPFDDGSCPELSG